MRSRSDSRADARTPEDGDEHTPGILDLKVRHCMNIAGSKHAIEALPHRRV